MAIYKTISWAKNLGNMFVEEFTTDVLYQLLLRGYSHIVFVSDERVLSLNKDISIAFEAHPFTNFEDAFCFLNKVPDHTSNFMMETSNPELAKIVDGVNTAFFYIKGSYMLRRG